MSGLFYPSMMMMSKVMMSMMMIVLYLLRQENWLRVNLMLGKLSSSHLLMPAVDVGAAEHQCCQM